MNTMLIVVIAEFTQFSCEVKPIPEQGLIEILASDADNQLLLERQRFGGNRFCAARPKKLCQRDNQVDRENKEITQRMDY